MKSPVKYILGISICLYLQLLPCSSVRAGAPSFGDNDPEGTPIDGGISMLVAAGVGYGVKKLNDKKKKSAEGINEDSKK